MSNHKKVVVWDELPFLLRKLRKKIIFEPEVIVGILNGGKIPSLVLGALMNVPVYFTKVESYKECKKIQAPVIVTPIELSSETKKVLIVDDLIDTGETLALIRQSLSQNRLVKEAVLFRKPWSPEVDFYVEEVKEWIVFPWELYGDR